MAATFPTSPSNGDTTTVNSITYVYASATRSWTRIPAGVPAGGSNTYVQFNDAGTASGTAGFTFNKTTNAVATTGSFSATGNITTTAGNAIVGNILTNGYYYANGVAFAGGGGGTPGGANTQIQYNNAGAFGGSAALTFNNSTNAVATSGTFSATGNITGGNLLTAGLVSSTGNITSAANISGGNLLATTTVSATSFIGTTISASGNITAGGHVGTIYTNSIINTGSNATGNIGSSSLYFNTVFAKATSAQYADVAEIYVADAPYIPGTVLNFGGDKEVTEATTSHSASIAGVVSTDPAYIMNAGQAGEFTVQVALLGRVPCKVVGQIRKGDRLVSSSIAGVAQALESGLYNPGCIIGKSLENYDSDQVGVIEVVVGRV